MERYFWVEEILIRSFLSYWRNYTVTKVNRSRQDCSEFLWVQLKDKGIGQGGASGREKSGDEI